MLEKIERINQIEEAMELIEQAKEMVDDAVKGTSLECHYIYYGRYGFNQLVGNGYDTSLQDLKNKIEEEK